MGLYHAGMQTACPPDSTSGVSSSVAVVIHSEDSEVVDDSAGKVSHA